MGQLDVVAERDEPMASINIVPFVDIVLVLLVIFMLTSAAIVKASIKVELPIWKQEQGEGGGRWVPGTPMQGRA